MTPSPLRSTLTAILFGALFFAGSIATLASDFVPASSTTPAMLDREYLGELRDRGLYSLGELYCTDLLARDDLDATRRTDLTIEHAYLLAKWASASPPQERDPLWQRSFDVLDLAIKASPNDPRALLVRMQWALCHALRGRQARFELELLRRTSEGQQLAIYELRAAINELRALDKAVADALMTSKEVTHDGSLTTDQLVALQKNIKFELATALMDRAVAYGPGTSDHSDSLAEALRLFTELSNLGEVHPLSWKSKLNQIECYGLLGDHAAAGRLLAGMLNSPSPPPPLVTLRARALRMEQALAQGQLDAAVTWLGEPNRLGWAVSPELDCARLHTYLMAWRHAAAVGDKAAAGQYQEKAKQTRDWIDQTYNPYWSRRAQLLLASVVADADEPISDLSLLRETAESHYHSGQLTEAIAAYDRIRHVALSQQKTEEAFGAGYTAATIEHKRNHHSQAADRYHEVAVSMPTHTEAPRAHRLAIHHAVAAMNAAGTAVDANTRRAMLDRIEAWLTEYLSLWPDAADAPGVRTQLGKFLQYRHDWVGATKVYRHGATAAAVQTPSPSPDAISSLNSAIACHLRQIEELKKAGNDLPATSAIREAADWTESLLKSGTSGVFRPGPWTAPMRTAALESARWRLELAGAGGDGPQGAADFDRAGQLLDAASRAADIDTQAPASWRANIGAMAVYALARRGRIAEAQTQLQALSEGSTDDLLGLLAGLSSVAADAQPALQGQLARLQLTTIDLLSARASTLTPEQRGRIAQIRQMALTARMEAQARTATTSASSTELRAALATWSDIEKQSAPGSARWFRAKLAMAELLIGLGEKEKARQVITLTKVLHPEMGGPEQKRKFEGLLQRCE